MFVESEEPLLLSVGHFKTWKVKLHISTSGMSGIIVTI